MPPHSAAPGGGSLVIDEREALTTIDVNSGSAVTAAGGESLAMEETCVPLPEAARQIRLRNLSGILLIDFIDMQSRRRAGSRAGRHGGGCKRRPGENRDPRLYQPGPSGNDAQATRDTLSDTMTQPCDACHGTGRVRRN